MMMFRPLSAAIGLVFFFLQATAPAWAAHKTAHPCYTPPEDLQRPISPEGCKHYILGFLEGALITDTAIIDSLQKETSDFMKRVYKTRAYRSKKTPPSTFLAKFCLPEPLDKNLIVENIFNDFTKQPGVNEGADRKIYTAFKTAYPCE